MTTVPSVAHFAATGLRGLLQDLTGPARAAGAVVGRWRRSGLSGGDRVGLALAGCLVLLAAGAGAAAAGSTATLSMASTPVAANLMPSPAPSPAPSPVPSPGAGRAAAAAEGGKPASGVMAAFDTTGASGVPISAYQLDLDHGGVQDPMKGVVALPVEFLWDGYRLAVGVAIWLYKAAAGMQWLDWLMPPAYAIAAALHSAITQVGLIPLCLTVLGVVSGFWMLRGRWAGGLAELVIGCVLATAATGFASSAVDDVASKEGLLGQAQTIGLEVSAAVTTLGSPSGSTGSGAGQLSDEQLQSATSGKLVDTFLRGPHQLINYGRILDGGPCGKAYKQALATPLASDGPPPDRSPLDYVTGSNLPPTPRSVVGQCDREAGAYAQNPSTGQLTDVVFLLPAGTLLILLMGLLTLAILAASAVVVWETAMLAINLVLGIIPGAARHSIYRGVASIAVSLAFVAGSLIAMAAYVLAIQAVLAPEPGRARNPSAVFLTLDLLLVVGIYLLLRWRGQAREAARRWGERISRLGPAAPVQLPTGRHGSMRALLGTASQVGTALALTRRMGAGAGLAAAAGPVLGTGARGRLRVGRLGRRGGLLGRAGRKRIGRELAEAGELATVLGKVAFGATIGAPVMVPRVTRRLSTRAQARNAQLRERLAGARQRAGAFGHEYMTNLATLDRVTARWSGAAWAGRQLGEAAIAPATAAMIATATLRDTVTGPGAPAAAAASQVAPLTPGPVGARAAAAAGSSASPNGPAVLPTASHVEGGQGRPGRRRQAQEEAAFGQRVQEGRDQDKAARYRAAQARAVAARRRPQPVRRPGSGGPDRPQLGPRVTPWQGATVGTPARNGAGGAGGAGAGPADGAGAGGAGRDSADERARAARERLRQAQQRPQTAGSGRPSKTLP